MRQKDFSTNKMKKSKTHQRVQNSKRLFYTNRMKCVWSFMMIHETVLGVLAWKREWSHTDGQAQSIRQTDRRTPTDKHEASDGLTDRQTDRLFPDLIMKRKLQHTSVPTDIFVLWSVRFFTTRPRRGRVMHKTNQYRLENLPFSQITRVYTQHSEPSNYWIRETNEGRKQIIKTSHVRLFTFMKISMFLVNEKAKNK